jgi:hypothetical protein
LAQSLLEELLSDFFEDESEEVLLAVLAGEDDESELDDEEDPSVDVPDELLELLPGATPALEELEAPERLSVL